MIQLSLHVISAALVTFDESLYLCPGFQLSVDRSEKAERALASAARFATGLLAKVLTILSFSMRACSFCATCFFKLEI